MPPLIVIFAPSAGGCGAWDWPWHDLLEELDSRDDEGSGEGIGLREAALRSPPEADPMPAAGNTQITASGLPAASFARPELPAIFLLTGGGVNDHVPGRSDGWIAPATAPEPPVL